MFALRGQTLTTYTVTDLGDMQIAREDFIGALAARETKGGVAFNAGFLYVSSEAGLEIYDLRNVRAGGTAPILVSRTPGLRYHRLAISGNVLAALYPGHRPAVLRERHARPIPNCFNQIDIYNVANPLAPGPRQHALDVPQPARRLQRHRLQLRRPRRRGQRRHGRLEHHQSRRADARRRRSPFRARSWSATARTSSASATTRRSSPTRSRPTGPTFFTPFTYHSTANLQVERANPIIFHPQAAFDEANGRLITMIDELDHQTLQPARTIAFDVFDYATAMLRRARPAPVRGGLVHAGRRGEVQPARRSARSSTSSAR